MSVEQSAFWNNLLSGFIGSLIGSGISLIAVFLQNKHASKLQEEALRLERRIAEEISFLDKVYNTLKLGKYALLRLGYASEAWNNKVNDDGFISNLLTFKSETNNYIDELIETMEYFNFLDETVKKFQIPSGLKEKLAQTIQDLVDELFKKTKVYPTMQQPSNPQELANIIKDRFEVLNKVIAEFESWLDNKIILIMEQRREVLAIEK